VRHGRFEQLNARKRKAERNAGRTVTEIEERAPEKKQERRPDQTTIRIPGVNAVTVILALFGTSLSLQAFKIPWHRWKARC